MHGLPPLSHRGKTEFFPRELRGIIDHAASLVPGLLQLVAAVRAYEAYSPPQVCYTGFCLCLAADRSSSIKPSKEQLKAITHSSGHFVDLGHWIESEHGFCRSSIPSAFWCCLDPNHHQWSPNSLLRVADARMFVCVTSGVACGGPIGIRSMVLVLLRVLVSLHSYASRGHGEEYVLSPQDILPYIRRAVSVLLNLMMDSLKFLRDCHAERAELRDLPMLVSPAVLESPMSPIAPYDPLTHSEECLYTPLFL